MKDYKKDLYDAKALIEIKDQEINRLTAKCELYRQLKNWTIISSIAIITLIILLYPN